LKPGARASGFFFAPQRRLPIFLHGDSKICTSTNVARQGDARANEKMTIARIF
jgi:hypothetical protein